MKVTRSALLPYSADQMYQIVADVETYPQFLSWCEQVELLSADGNVVEAKLKVSYSKLNIEFSTRNINIPGKSIQLALLDGPFTQLDGKWTFLALNEGACKVSLEMDFAFRSSITKKALSGVFKKMVSTQLDAFEKRAKTVYAKQLEEDGNAID